MLALQPVDTMPQAFRPDPVTQEEAAAMFRAVLNLFGNREGVSGLTRWDMAYLTGLYEAEQNRINPNAQARGVADAAVWAHRTDPADPSPEE